MLLPAHPDHFFPSCSPAPGLPVCAFMWYCSIPSAVPNIFIWTSCRCWLSRAPRYLDPFTRPLVPPDSQQFSLASSANSLKMHSTPVYRPLIKMLNSTGTRTEPWGILPVTAYQPNVFPLTMNLCALPFSQIITQQRTTQLTGWTVTFAIDVLKKYFFYWHHTK